VIEPVEGASHHLIDESAARGAAHRERASEHLMDESAARGAGHRERSE
jgi:hypothetical protein